MDRQTGLTPADTLTVQILRKALPEEAHKRLLLVVNKCDGARHDLEAVEFYSLGCGDPLTVSAEHGRGMYELWESVNELVPEDMRHSWSDEESSEELQMEELSDGERKVTKERQNDRSMRYGLRSWVVQTLENPHWSIECSVKIDM